jgi:hypothetical protein
VQSQVVYADSPDTGPLLICPWTAMILALVAGAAVWTVIDAVHPVFHIPQEFHAAMGAGEAKFAENRRAQDIVERKHAMLYVGGLGLSIALCLALCEGILRRSWIAPLVAVPPATAGGVLGGFLGCLVYEYVRKEVGQAELTHTIAAQLLLAAPLGLGVGLGLGLTTRTVGGAIQSAVGGLAAGLLVSVFYPIIVSIALPGASTDTLLPDDRGSRLLWLALLSGLIGLVIPIAGRRRKQKRPASPEVATA